MVLCLSLSPRCCIEAPPVNPMISTLDLSLAPPQRSLSVVQTDERAIAHLIDELLSASGLSVNELAKRMGCQRSSINQYRYLRRVRPSIQWLTKLVEVCG